MKYLPDENRCLKNAQQEMKNARPREKTCACTDRVFLAEVERRNLSDKLGNLYSSESSCE